jgi:2'-phosphotransferase
LKAIVAVDAKKRYDLKEEEGIWWIRANQGHSMKDVADLETTPINSISDIPTGIAVHGTTLKAWKSIAKEGLSKMTRNHIHLAQGLAGPDSSVISGMRKSSQVLVYIDVKKALEGGLKFVLSSNGVVLSSGDQSGHIPPVFFEKAIDAKTGQELRGWRPAEGDPATATSERPPVETAAAT